MTLEHKLSEASSGGHGPSGYSESVWGRLTGNIVFAQSLDYKSRKLPEGVLGIF